MLKRTNCHGYRGSPQREPHGRREGPRDALNEACQADSSPHLERHSARLSTLQQFRANLVSASSRWWRCRRCPTPRRAWMSCCNFSRRRRRRRRHRPRPPSSGSVLQELHVGISTKNRVSALPRGEDGPCCHTIHVSIHYHARFHHAITCTPRRGFAIADRLSHRDSHTVVNTDHLIVGLNMIRPAPVSR